MERCYVYLHMDGTEVVYVGKGQDGRAWATTGRKCSAHFDWMRQVLPCLSVVIVESNLSELSALGLEKGLVQRYAPKFNLKRKGGAKTVAHLERVRPKVDRPVLTPQGRFESIRVAATALGLAYSTAQDRAQSNRKGWSYAD